MTKMTHQDRWSHEAELDHMWWKSWNKIDAQGKMTIILKTAAAAALITCGGRQKVKNFAE